MSLTAGPPSYLSQINMVVSSLGHYGHWDLGLIWPRPRRSATPCPNKAKKPVRYVGSCSRLLLEGTRLQFGFLFACLFVYFQRLWGFQGLKHDRDQEKSGSRPLETEAISRNTAPPRSAGVGGLPLRPQIWETFLLQPAFPAEYYSQLRRSER